MEPVVKSDVQLLIEDDRFESTFRFNFNDNVNVRILCTGPIRFIREMVYLGNYEQFKEEIDACVNALFRLLRYYEILQDVANSDDTGLRAWWQVAVKLKYIYHAIGRLRDAALRDGVIVDRAEIELPLLSIVEHVFEDPVDGWYLTKAPFSFVEQVYTYMDWLELGVDEGFTHVWLKVCRSSTNVVQCSTQLQISTASIDLLLAQSEKLLEGSTAALKGLQFGDPVMRALAVIVNAEEDVGGRMCRFRAYDLLSLLANARTIDASNYAGQVYLHAIACLIRSLHADS